MKIRQTLSLELTQEEAAQLVTEMAEIDSVSINWGTELRMLSRLRDVLTDLGVRSAVQFREKQP